MEREINKSVFFTHCFSSQRHEKQCVNRLNYIVNKKFNFTSPP